ncbi:MAG TPA: GH92 family glycosyl hydrolase [Vicinamibacteria bacterium]|nr:GH92 family glycosyl hydrolase [Vicinamibacteria bacterium]
MTKLHPTGDSLRMGVAGIALLLAAQPPLKAQAPPASGPGSPAPYDDVNPFIGTGGEGHTYPGATVPFGMVQLSPETDVRYFRESFPWAAGYRHSDSTILGFAHTHFSGTGHSDLGDVLVMPTVGPLQLEPGSADNPDAGYRSRFSHDQESASPGYYSVLLQDHAIKAELTATNRVGVHRYTFPESRDAHLILDLVSSIYNYDGKVLWSEIRVESDRLVTGFRQTKGWAPNRHLYFALEFSKPFSSYGLVNEAEEHYRGFGRTGRLLENYPQAAGRKLKAYFNFSTQRDEPMLVKVALSSVGIDGALKNLRAEVPGWDFEGVKQAAKAAWSRELGKIAVEGEQKERQIFYTALYHTMLAPVTYMDVDGRYRGADQAIHQAQGFTNYHIFSLWDTYRAAHPLFTILHPQRNGEMIRSMLAHREQSVHGILPVWSFGSQETWCMIGYHAVSVIADAFLKGITNFDATAAFEAMKASATYRAYGGLDGYLRYGYVPVDQEKEAASKTLEYAYDDWTIAQMARALGRQDDHRRFLQRAGSFRNIFDPATGFMRAKKTDGSFREPFDPVYAQYGSDYTEGNAWQYSWYVPHDVQGLIDLLGGPDRFVARLDQLFTLQVSEEKYKHVEDISGLIGQYAHGNEPSQHIAYLYSYAGQPWRTQERVRQIMTTLFDNTPEGISGNEDCGQMSAWYIFGALGFYPVSPGSLEYAIGAPQLQRAAIDLGNGKTFTMRAENLSTANLYIQSATLNGQPYGKAYLRHQDIMAGGTLSFVMGPAPNRSWASAPESAPYSMSRTRGATPPAAATAAPPVAAGPPLAVPPVATAQPAPPSTKPTLVPSVRPEPLNRLALAASVRDEFLHSWQGYKRHAWGHDELKPVTRTPHDWYGETLHMTPVDALDTMLIMGLTEEADRTRDFLAENLSFDKDVTVKNFEITIRLLGGLLSAYQMTEDRRLLALAEDLGTRLLPAFDSPTGMPYMYVNLKTGKASGAKSNPAEIGTLLLEFGTLARLTGKDVFYDRAKRALVGLFARRSRIGLVGEEIDVETGAWVSRTSHVGGGIDSYYEYLLKCVQLFGDRDCGKMWRESRRALDRYLADEEATGLWYGEADMRTGRRTATTYGALHAFLPSVLALGGDLHRARRLQDSGFRMWTLHGIEPEVLDYRAMRVVSPGYQLRPEIIESAYYLHRLTKDPRYLDMGRTFLDDLKRHCRTESGYTTLKSVVTKEKGDLMPSYFLAETLKYLYLLFHPQTVEPNGAVFNTEAHPLRRTW